MLRMRFRPRHAGEWCGSHTRPCKGHTSPRRRSKQHTAVMEHLTWLLASIYGAAGRDSTACSLKCLSRVTSLVELYNASWRASMSTWCVSVRSKVQFIAISTENPLQSQSTHYWKRKVKAHCSPQCIWIIPHRPHSWCADALSCWCWSNIVWMTFNHRHWALA